MTQEQGSKRDEPCRPDDGARNLWNGGLCTYLRSVEEPNTGPIIGIYSSRKKTAAHRHASPRCSTSSLTQRTLYMYTGCRVLTVTLSPQKQNHGHAWRVEARRFCSADDETTKLESHRRICPCREEGFTDVSRPPSNGVPRDGPRLCTNDRDFASVHADQIPLREDAGGHGQFWWLRLLALE